MPKGVYDRSKAKPRGRPRKEMREIVEEKILPVVRKAFRQKQSVIDLSHGRLVGTVALEIAGKRVTVSSDGEAIVVRVEP